jgi:glutamine amidotransferase
MAPQPGVIGVVDYGMGNIGSVCHALDLLGGRYVVSSRWRAFEEVAGIVLPGVGAFDAAMRNLHALDLVEALTGEVMGRRKPFLGICLGMQLLAKDSTENGLTSGLGWLDGHVREIDARPGVRVPHVGWNGLQLRRTGTLFERISEDAHFYFDHSFHLRCSQPDAVSALFDYGATYVAALERDNILAVQFHPEKSQRNGLKLLRNFLRLVERTAAAPRC